MLFQYNIELKSISDSTLLFCLLVSQICFQTAQVDSLTSLSVLYVGLTDHAILTKQTVHLPQQPLRILKACHQKCHPLCL